MKTSAVSLAAISLIQLVAAQPHRHAHKLQHQKKDVITVLETVVAYATAAPEVIVYVDDDGKPVSSKTNGLLSATASFSTVTPSVTATPVAAAEVASPAPPVPTTASKPAVPAPPAGSDATGFGYSYTPYNGDGTCKTATQVLTDFAAFGPGVGLIRTYGTDCSTIANVYPACKKYGYKLFAGIFDISDLSNEINLIAAGVAGDWSAVDTVSVGNELVNSNQASPDAVTGAVGTAKGLLKAQGYTGPVVTVDTLAATLINPELCDSSDYCAVNCHPFFDPNTAASAAGSFLQSSIGNLKSKLANPSQRIFISETGWPSQGGSNGAAVPSPDNQETAVSAIKAALPPGSFNLLAPYNTLWKKNNGGTFGAEQFWGILGNCPSG